MLQREPFMSVGMLRFLRCLAVAFCAAATFLAVDASAEGEALRGARVTVGELLPQGDGLVAGPAGATVSFEHGSELRVDAGAKIRFDRQQQLHLGWSRDPMVPARVLFIESGAVTATVPSATRFALLMLGPRKLQAILRSGEAMMIASDDRVTVAALHGTTLVTLAEKWRPLREGSMQVVSVEHPEGLRREILGVTEAPVLSRSLLIEGDGADSSALLGWPALASAVAYDVRAQSGDAVIHEIRTTEPRALLSQLAAGTYQLSIRGVDDAGVRGAASPVVSLNVMGLRIPPTASRAPDGAIRLQPGQRVSLVGAEGLEVSYLGQGEFLPVPETLGLVARRPIALTLRHRESGETLRLNLEPMLVKAKIQFVRQPYVWPREGLAVTVKLIDDKGYPLPENFVVSCRVTINAAATNATWQRDGAKLRTSIRRPEGAGPWMVRVDVLDEGGASIGKDFSEVGYGGAPAQAARR